MANIDMCRHEWPGSGCKECTADAALSPMAQALYDAHPDWREVPQKVEWAWLSEERKDHFRKLARAALSQQHKGEGR